MRFKVTLSSLLAVLLLMFHSTFATVSEVQIDATTEKATTGTNVVVSVTVTATTTETTSIQLISSPSGIVITDPPTGYYSSVLVSTTPVTKTFTITAGTAGTYTYYAQAGTVQSISKTIVFVEPTTLTVSGSPSSVIKTVGQSFTLTIFVTNPQAESITTSYSLDCPSGLVCTGDPTSNTITLGGGVTTTLTWTVTCNSAGNYVIRFQLGDNPNAFTTTVRVSSVEEEAPAEGGAAGFVTGLIEGIIKESRTWASIASGEIVEWMLQKPEIGVTSIKFTLKNAATNVKMEIKLLLQKPEDLPDIGKVVYQYLQIDKVNIKDEDFENVTISFKVNKSWVLENSIDYLTIRLMKYDNGTWVELPTTFEEEDENF